MSILNALVEIATMVISALGYPGVFILMAMESMVFPVPSEAVMPFAGFLVATGRFPSLLIVTLVATLGTLAGSYLSYWMGAKYGEGFVRKYGKWLLIEPHDMEKAHNFFKKRGGWAIFLARFIPVVRHVISIPAGSAKMRHGPFITATLAGGFLWNYFLAYWGMKLGENWERIGAMLEPFEYLIIGLLAAGIGYFVYRHVRREN